MHIRKIGFDAEFLSCGRHELRRLNFGGTGNFASKPSELSFFSNIKKRHDFLHKDLAMCF
jgi:hypothetical protein